MRAVPRRPKVPPAMRVGIEAINCDVGQTFIDVRDLSQARGLDAKRFDGLMMEKKSVSLPCQDPVTYAVNAAKPIIDALGEAKVDALQVSPDELKAELERTIDARR